MEEMGFVSVIRSVEGSKKGRFRNEKFTATGHGRTKSSLLLVTGTDEKFTPTGPVTSRSEFYTALLMPTNWELSTARTAARADRS